MKAYRFEVFVIDHDDYGADEYVTIIEQHRHLNASVGKVDTIEIGEWDDDHPLNSRRTDKGEYFRKALEQQQEK